MYVTDTMSVMKRALGNVQRERVTERECVCEREKNCLSDSVAVIKRALDNIQRKKVTERRSDRQRE